MDSLVGLSDTAFKALVLNICMALKKAVKIQWLSSGRKPTIILFWM
jgi:hypothetical protein